MKRFFVCALAAYVAGGCAHRIDRVDQRLLLPESAERYAMAAHQAFVYPGNCPANHDQIFLWHNFDDFQVLNRRALHT